MFQFPISQQQHKSIIQRVRISQFNIIEERNLWIRNATAGHGGLILRLAGISATKLGSDKFFKDLFKGFLEGPADTNLSKATVPNWHQITYKKIVKPFKQNPNNSTYQSI